MKETTHRNQRIYLRFEDAGHGMMRLAASLPPPAYSEPVLVLLSRGIMPLGQPVSLLLVSDPSQNEALRGKAATVRVGTVTAGAVGSSPVVANSGTDTAAVFDFTLPAGYIVQAAWATKTRGLTVDLTVPAITALSSYSFDNWLLRLN